MNSRFFLTLLTAIALTATGMAWAAESKVRIELTGSWTDVHPNPDSYWMHSITYPDPGIDGEISGGGGFRFNELRVFVPVGEVEIFAGFEREPEFVSTTMFSLEPDQMTTEVGTAWVEAIDLGVVVPLRAGQRWLFRPWGALTHIRSYQDVSMDLWYDYVPAHRANFVLDSRHTAELWGIAYGAEASVNLANRIDLAARAVQRWGHGSTTSQSQGTSDFYDLPYHPGDPPVSTEPWDRTTKYRNTVGMMYGFDLGVQGIVARWITLEGGWRYRNWTYQDTETSRDWNRDRGPGSYDGPYLRAIFAW